MKETKIKHFFEYLDYENIVNEDYSFELPSKNDKGIFITNLSKPFAFYLPKSELCDMFQDVYGNNVINYIINLDCHSEIVQFLENFDTLCINNASDNSKKWFGKDLNSEKLIKYYNTLYELSEDEKTLYLPIAIGTEDIEEIIRYNENSDLILSVKITGIEFFQQTFRWRIEFNSIVESVEESEDDDVNFDKMVQTSNNLESLPEMKHSSDEYVVNTDKKDDEYIEEQYVDNYDENVEQEQTEYTEELQEYLDYQENEDLIAGREIQLDNSDEYENYYEQSEEEYRDEEYEHDENRNHEEEYEHDENECHRESDEDPHDNEEHQYYEDDEQSYYEENPQEDENQEMYEEENQEEYYEEEQQSGEDEHDFIEEDQQSREEEQQSREEEQQLREEDEQSREEEHQSREEEQQSREEERVDEHNSPEQKLEESRNDVEKNEESHNEEMEDTKLNPSMIEDLAEETTIKNDNNLSNDTIQEITSIISEKRLEAKKYTINASRAKRALDTLSLKADEVNREIELYENKLRACQS